MTIIKTIFEIIIELTKAFCQDIDKVRRDKINF